MPALELGGMTLGLREGVIGLIALVAAYMLFVLLRMLFLPRKSGSRRASEKACKARRSMPGTSMSSA